mmetsp:Transcript_34772/g.99892  ORF Transcript_34772/g.99892 Transcript_34772/m.99892 type:complete len:236 (+) Transcript_34772:798-1505(+)
MSDSLFKRFISAVSSSAFRLLASAALASAVLEDAGGRGGKSAELLVAVTPAELWISKCRRRGVPQDGRACGGGVARRWYCTGCAVPCAFRSTSLAQARRSSPPDCKTSSSSSTPMPPLFWDLPVAPAPTAQSLSRNSPAACGRGRRASLAASGLLLSVRGEAGCTAPLPLQVALLLRPAEVAPSKYAGGSGADLEPRPSLLLRPVSPLGLKPVGNGGATESTVTDRAGLSSGASI